ncbi:hypothetical protein [Brevibacterium litoralis]|uniref:hypothetical protein n=1 Tax=Brevibacterium litoralis TaxID=3138935 RepID=UPI0032EF34E9
METETTAQDVIEQLGTSDNAKNRLARWKSNRPAVARHVLQHVTRVPYIASIDQYEKVLAETEPPLAEIKKSRIGKVREMADWSPNFAFMHVFHYALEEIGEPYTYQGFRDFCREDVRAREMIWDPAVERIRQTKQKYDDGQAREAMRWRVATAYCSFVRELRTFAYIRNCGIPLKIHPLADALYRVDAWIDKVVVDLYLVNPQYRQGSEGRKIPSRDIVGAGFHYLDLTIPNKRHFGRIYLVDDEEAEKAARKISTFWKTVASGLDSKSK